MTATGKVFCKCGCGAEVPQGYLNHNPKLYIDGHKKYTKHNIPESERKSFGETVFAVCQCGCGQDFSYVYKRGPRTKFIESHRPVLKRDQELRDRRSEQKRAKKHQLQKPKQMRLVSCGCGCGALVPQRQGKPSYVRGHAHSGLWREKISASMKNKYKDHGYKQRVARAVAAAHPKARPGKPVEFDGITYRSTWEAARAAQLKTAGIPFEYESHQLPYTAADGITHHYIPDFWLPTLGRFEEVKGFFREKDKVKMSRAVAQNPGVTVVVIELLQEWRWIERGEAPDVNAVALSRAG